MMSEMLDCLEDDEFMAVKSRKKRVPRSSMSGEDSESRDYIMRHIQSLNDYDSSEMASCSSPASLAAGRNTVGPKSELCRYFMHAGGCVRGSSCYFAHSERELLTSQRYSRTPLEEIKQGYTNNIDPRIISKKNTEDLGKKVFIGGLSPAVDSDDLRDYFESHFGTVTDAIVIGSQAGDTSFSSRGFGFVTFKHESSVVAAVKEHYVVLLGKKVEIKSAVPRPVMQAAEMSAEAARNQQQLEIAMEHRHGESVQDSGICKSCHLTNIDSSNDQENAWHQMHSRSRVFDEGGSINHEGLAEEAEKTASLEISPVPLPLTHGSRPQWLLKLRSWLPKFLTSVSNRLFEGEWYPLSSLKGDFRATCGMELDHVTIGYPKLSDFVRSLHDICRMKIVPVGRGPATHMVLLPPVSRPEIFGPNKAQAFKSSLVDAGRSYAAAAQSKLESPASETNSEETNTSADVSSGYMFESYKQALVDKAESNDASAERSSSSERPVMMHNPDAEYISELMSLLSRPESESQRAVIEAYRQISQKSGEKESANESARSQDDGESSDQEKASPKSLPYGSSIEDRTMVGPDTPSPQPTRHATPDAEDLLPDSPFGLKRSTSPMSLGVAYVPLNRAPGSALIQESECSNPWPATKEQSKSHSPTSLQRVRALLSEYGKNPPPDHARDQWPLELPRRSSFEEKPSFPRDVFGSSDRFSVDRLVRLPNRTPPPLEQPMSRNTGMYPPGIDPSNASWLPWQAPGQWFAPPLPPGPPPIHHGAHPGPLQMHSPRPGSMLPGQPMGMQMRGPPHVNPGVGEELVCILCWERRALWINVPCGHRSLCTTCKDTLQRRPGPHFCMCCNHLVQGWRF